MAKKLVMIGAGGHANVVSDILERENFTISAYADRVKVDCHHRFFILPQITDEKLLSESPLDYMLVNGIGMLPGKSFRIEIYNRFKLAGFRFKTIVAPDSNCSQYVVFEQGVQVLCGAIVNSGVVINENTIVNTGAIVEHDCVIGSHCHIAPGATLSGAVKMGNCVHIGTNATVIQGIKIGDNCVIGAGAVVTKDIPSNHIVYPARTEMKNLRNIE